MEYHVYLIITKKFLFWIFGRWKIWYILCQRVDGNMIFTDCWIKRSCFELFGDGKYGLFLSQNVDEKMIFTDYWKLLVLYWKVLVSHFLAIGNTAFFQSKRWWKDDIYLVFLSFSWYSRTWEIWFFAESLSKSLQSFGIKTIISLYIFYYWQ